MPLIVAIEPDRRQTAQLSALGRGPLRGTELVVAESTERALALPGVLGLEVLAPPPHATAVASTDSAATASAPRVTARRGRPPFEERRGR